MEDHKRSIIINEINQWRKNKLLPESYCIFLLNLYSEGEHSNASEKTGRVPLDLSIKSILNILMIVTILLIGINFNSFPHPLQIGIFVLLLLLLYGTGYYLQRKLPLLSHLFLGMASVGVLFSGNIIFSLDTPQEAIPFLIFTCVTWIAVGLTTISFFQAPCGFIGFLLIYGWYIHDNVLHGNMATAQLYWLPECLFFFWLFLVSLTRQMRLTLSFGITAMIMWIAPELHFVIDAGFQSYLLQGLFLGKITVLIIVLLWTMKHSRHTRSIEMG